MFYKFMTCQDFLLLHAIKIYALKNFVLLLFYFIVDIQPRFFITKIRFILMSLFYKINNFINFKYN